MLRVGPVTGQRLGSEEPEGRPAYYLALLCSGYFPRVFTKTERARGNGARCTIGA